MINVDRQRDWIINKMRFLKDKKQKITGLGGPGIFVIPQSY